MHHTRTSLFLTAVAIAFMVLAPSAQAATWYVATNGVNADPTTTAGAGTQAAPFATIQYAIDNAAAGDTINVEPGSYLGSLTWTKDLTIHGDGAATCSIYGGKGVNGLTTTGLTASARVSGFTFVNCHNYHGGAMYNSSSSPTVADCTFSGNASDLGGAMYNTGGSSPIVTNCIFSGNIATFGGGIYNDEGSPVITGCTFSANLGGNWGGGIYNYGGHPTIINCIFTGNSSVSLGGAVTNSKSGGTAANCLFIGNSSGGGGGVWNYACSPTIANCAFVGNFAWGGGGGMANGGSIDEGGSNPIVTNCILWGNNAPNGPGIDNFDSSSSPTVTYTDWQDLSMATPDANHNFASDPLFVRNPGTNGVADFGDLRLQPGSPCIDKGNNAAVTTANGFLMNPTNTYFIDLDGSPRIVGASVDMGAYEFQNVRLQAESQVQALMNSVTNLVNGGVLLPANGQPLYAKLDAAIAYLQAGDSVDAISVLQAFINQVNALIKTGRLTSTDGQNLISQAQSIISLLGG